MEDGVDRVSYGEKEEVKSIRGMLQETVVLLGTFSRFNNDE